MNPSINLPYQPYACAAAPLYWPQYPPYQMQVSPPPMMKWFPWPMPPFSPPCTLSHLTAPSATNATDSIRNNSLQTKLPIDIQFATELAAMTAAAEVEFELERLKPPQSHDMHAHVASLAEKKNLSKAEAGLAHALQEIFGPDKRFIKVRPDWLRNNTGRKMELDLYCRELGLAIERDGYQHVVWPNNFHHTREEFEAQLARDRLKERLCRRNGVVLIRVPWTVKINQMQWYLRNELTRLNFPMSSRETDHVQ